MIPSHFLKFKYTQNKAVAAIIGVQEDGEHLGAYFLFKVENRQLSSPLCFPSSIIVGATDAWTAGLQLPTQDKRGFIDSFSL